MLMRCNVILLSIVVIFFQRTVLYAVEQPECSQSSNQDHFQDANLDDFVVIDDGAQSSGSDEDEGIPGVFGMPEDLDVSKARKAIEELNASQTVKEALWRILSDVTLFSTGHRPPPPLLQVAVMEGDHQELDLILKMACDRRALYLQESSGGWTIFHVAASRGCSSRTRMLYNALEDRKDVSDKKKFLAELIVKYDEEGDAPLHVAANNGHSAVFDVFCEIVRDSGLSIKEFLVQATSDDYQFSSLHLSVLRNYSQFVNKIMKMVRQFDLPEVLLQRNGHGWTALQFAAESGYADVVTELLNENISLELRMQMLLQKTQTRLLQSSSRVMCLTEKIDFSQSFGHLPLQLAARNGHTETIIALLNGVRDPEKLLLQPNEDGIFALHLAAAKGHAQSITALLSYAKNKQAVLTKLDRRGVTALHLAAFNGHEEAVKALVDAATDVQALLMETIPKFSLSPLCWIADKGDEKMSQVLLNHAPNRQMLLMQPNIQGLRPLTVTVSQGHVKCMMTLLNAAEDMQKLLMQTDLEGWAPLHHAIDQANTEAITALLNAAPNKELILTQETQDGWNPKSIATHGKDENVIKMVEDALKRYTRPPTF